jgi:hypothetical protein
MIPRNQALDDPAFWNRSTLELPYDWHLYLQYILAQNMAQATVMTERLAQQSEVCRQLFADRERYQAEAIQTREVNVQLIAQMAQLQGIVNTLQSKAETPSLESDTQPSQQSPAIAGLSSSSTAQAPGPIAGPIAPQTTAQAPGPIALPAEWQQTPQLLKNQVEAVIAANSATARAAELQKYLEMFQQRAQINEAKNKIAPQQEAIDQLTTEIAQQRSTDDTIQQQLRAVLLDTQNKLASSTG